MSDVVLKMVGITKVYPGVKALDNVNLQVIKGEVHALAGENGAGKSTLMKVLNGVITDFTGDIFINGKKIDMKSPISAQENGISIIFQEFNLVNTLSVAENVFLGRLDSNKTGFIEWSDIYTRTEKFLEEIGLKVSAKSKISELSVAEKQMVEIAKALSYNAEIIVMDEPSSALTKTEMDNLYNIIDNLKKKGVTIIYISHRMEEIFKISDSITILRDGKDVHSCPIGEITKNEIIEKMVGRSIDVEFPKRKPFLNNEVILEVKNLNRKNVLNDVSFKLYKGEILGISGLVGSGRTEVLRAIFGADKIDSGEIIIKGKSVSIKNPISAKQHGIAFLTEDRKLEGLILKFAIKTNISITKLKGICTFGLLSNKKEKDISGEYIKKLGVKTPSSKQKAINLSGGNQQKVVLAKWLFSESDIIFLDEPTRGIDVGAKFEIYCIMNDLVKLGKSIIMVSSELPEVLAMSDRILVMHGGEIKGELGSDFATAEKIMECALGNPDDLLKCVLNSPEVS